MPCKILYLGCDKWCMLYFFVLCNIAVYFAEIIQKEHTLALLFRTAMRPQRSALAQDGSAV